LISEKESSKTTFSVEKTEEADIKDVTNFMDKAMEVTPEAIMSNVQEAFKDIMTNPKLKDAKRSLAAAAMSAGTIFANANPAHAI